MNGAVLKAPVFVDGAIYAGIACCTALSAGFATDDAAKFIVPPILFWLKLIVGSMGATLLAVKMFRSTTFAEHQQKQKEDSNHQWQREMRQQPKPEIKT